MKRIVLIVAVVMVAAVSGFLWYSQRAKQRALESGDVYVRNEGAAAPANPPSGSPAASIATATPQEAAASPKPSAASEASTVHASEKPAPHVQPEGAIAVPAGDTIQRNPPVGLAYAGSGKYQLYRQGDVTWRFNTDTGQACILFATDPLWSKSRVYAHGCGAS